MRRGSWACWSNALILTVVTGGLLWSVLAGDRHSGAYWAMGFWFFLGGWAVPRSSPDSATWVLALIAVGCAGTAVIFFVLYMWAGWPSLAYMQAIIFGLCALNSVVAIWLKRLRLQPPQNTTDTGEQG